MMASCRSRPSLGDAWTLTAPPEAIVGDPFSLVVCPPRGGAGPRDWVGLYPASVPTVAGVSQGRWLYISAACSGGSSSRPGSPLPPPPRGPVRLDWPAHMLPNHAGLFEFRVHGAGGYGPALAVARVAVLPGRSHTVRRGVAFAVLICAVWAFQSLLNAKGVCVWAPPETTPDPIIDHCPPRRRTYTRMYAFAASAFSDDDGATKLSSISFQQKGAPPTAKGAVGTLVQRRNAT
jgi:hypothetical protein